MKVVSFNNIRGGLAIFSADGKAYIAFDSGAVAITSVPSYEIMTRREEQLKHMLRTQFPDVTVYGEIHYKPDFVFPPYYQLGFLREGLGEMVVVKDYVVEREVADDFAIYVLFDGAGKIKDIRSMFREAANVVAMIENVATSLAGMIQRQTGKDVDVRRDADLKFVLSVDGDMAVTVNMTRCGGPRVVARFFSLYTIRRGAAEHEGVFEFPE